MLSRRRQLKRGSFQTKGDLRRDVSKKIKVFKKLRHAGAVIPRTGPKYTAWQQYRDDWFVRHNQDTYECWLQISPYCPKFMKRKYTTLDHIKPRSFYPELEYEDSNIRPACKPCNDAKGSTIIIKE